jgi:peptidoglycan-associated lipoprotein
MKHSLLVQVLALGLILGIGGAGCKHGPGRLIPIPGQKTIVQHPPPGPAETNLPPVAPESLPIATNLPTLPSGATPLAPLERFEDRPADREVFKAFTVYFDFDQSVIKPSETSKIEAIAEAIKKGPAGNDLAIEGHCDERGTEEYNRALGERRALAVREYLIKLGIGSGRIRTISFGEDKPVDQGHNEDAWAKNRRGEFLLLLPKP